jgi:hypothetical protein
VALGQFLQEPLASLDVLAGDLALGDADRLGHLRQDVLVAPGGDASDEDLEHPIVEPPVLAHRLVGGDLDFAGLTGLLGLLPQPGLGDFELAFLEGDTARLRAVVGDLAVGLLPLLLGAGDLSSAHEEDGVDGSPSHDVDEVVDGGLSVLDEIEHGEEELAVLGQDLGEGLGIERRGAVRQGNDLVALSHRWWLLCKGLTTTR